MSKPLLSVIIPVYNVENYLHECLNSVLNQSYKNIEIIVINDGSTDKSKYILDQYASNYNNIKIITQENQGQSVARNKGIELANGKYIYFLDADDYILPETFSELIPEMEEKNLDLIRFSAIPFTDKIDFNINKKQYDFSKFYNSSRVYSRYEFIKLNFRTFSPSPVLFIVKKDILVNKKISFKPGIYHEDELFTLEVFLNTNRVMYKPKSYYMRRYRENSTMTNILIEEKIKSFESNLIVLNELKKLMSRYTEKHEINLIKRRIRTVMTALVCNYNDLDYNYRKEQLKKIDDISLIKYLYLKIRKRTRDFIISIKS